ncbi:hypothetical protein GCM10022409_49420 [Hymenobacter glaciei]|uniref:DUF4440 domain-containing protein n=1 Tax=Hymenobacter glaciei TaxID=877209 RepID=A0ABP7UZQ6_9BACT
MLRQFTVLALVAFLAITGAFAQSQPKKPAIAPASATAASSSATVDKATSELYKQVAKLDAEIFAAFNAHDVTKLMSYFADNLEFFHDKGGLANFSQTKQGFERMFAQSPDISRSLVPGSLEVYPIKGYGAVHIATQRFCHVENGREDCGNSKFVMVWQQQAGTWKIARVVSYDH